MNSIAAQIAHTPDSERGLAAIVAGFMVPRDRDAALRVSALIAVDLVTMVDAAERDVDGFLNSNRGSFGRSNRAPDADGKWRVVAAPAGRAEPEAHWPDHADQAARRTGRSTRAGDLSPDRTAAVEPRKRGWGWLH